MRKFLVVTLMIFAGLAHAGPVFTGGWFGKGPAIKGYDPVAYFVENKAVEGSEAFTATHDGAVWRFASAQHRDLFLANPDQYLPAYGGYCAYAMGAKNQKVKVDPTVFTIVDGRLFLNYSEGVRDDWLQRRDEYIQQGDKNWLTHAGDAD